MLRSLFSSGCASPNTPSYRPKVAIIGAGITGVGAACQCLDSGFDVRIFEANSREKLGGIWTQVNQNSTLQTHSMAYQFHRRVRWKSKYPNRGEIVGELTRLWNHYELECRTMFDTKITSVSRDSQGHLRIKESLNDYFDGIIVAIGTCYRPRKALIPKEDCYKGQVFHSSQLSGKQFKGQKLVVIGGGASAAEAMDFLVQSEAAEINVIVRSQKWIIPRAPIIGFLLSLNIASHLSFLGSVPEFFLRKCFYRDLQALAPIGKGLFTDTPVCNSDVLDMVRSGKVNWLHGEVTHFDERGVTYKPAVSPACSPKEEAFVEADTIFMATGYHRPSLDFLPSDSCCKPYEAPNWYLQNFPIGYPDICAINSTWIHGIGTVGGSHIGVYTRILLMFLVDHRTRPDGEQMRAWVDQVRRLKSSGTVDPLAFVTWGELQLWFLVFIFRNPLRWGWCLFLLFGIGRALPVETNARERGTEDVISQS